MTYDGHIKQLENKPGNGKSTKFVLCNNKSKLRNVNQDGSQQQVLTPYANEEQLKLRLKIWVFFQHFTYETRV